MDRIFRAMVPCPPTQSANPPRDRPRPARPIPPASTRWQCVLWNQSPLPELRVKAGRAVHRRPSDQSDFGLRNSFGSPTLISSVWDNHLRQGVEQRSVRRRHPAMMYDYPQSGENLRVIDPVQQARPGGEGGLEGGLLLRRKRIVADHDDWDQAKSRRCLG